MSLIFAESPSEYAATPCLTAKLLLPVAGDLAALRLDRLLALGARAGSLAGAKATVALIGHADAPLPLTAVGLALLLSCFQKGGGGT